MKKQTNKTSLRVSELMVKRGENVCIYFIWSPEHASTCIRCNRGYGLISALPASEAGDSYSWIQDIHPRKISAAPMASCPTSRTLHTLQWEDLGSVSWGCLFLNLWEERHTVPTLAYPRSSFNRLHRCPCKSSLVEQWESRENPS